MAVLAAATRDAAALAAGEHETEKGAELKIVPGEVERIIADWPEAVKLGAHQLLEQYGTGIAPLESHEEPGPALRRLTRAAARRIITALVSVTTSTNGNEVKP